MIRRLPQVRLACVLFGLSACEISDRTVAELDETTSGGGASSSPSAKPAGSAGTAVASGVAGSTGVTGVGGAANVAGAAGSNANPPADDRCVTDCIRAAFNGPSPSSCRVCHGGPVPLGGLDLTVSNVTARLRDVAAQHIDTPPGACSVGERLIDTRSWNDSWLLKKVKGQQGNCGSRMPAPPFPPADVVCIEGYVRCVAGQ